MKNTRFAFSVVLFFYLYNSVYSQQNLFNKIYTDYEESSAYGIVEDANNYYIGGTLKNSVDFADKIFIKWVPKSPFSYVTKIWSFPNFHFCSYGRRTFIRTFDNGFAMTGHISGFGYDIHGFLIKFNSNCDTLWMKRFYDTISNINDRYLRLNNFIETSDKGFALVGEINASGSQNHDMVFIKTDSLGNTEWYNTYGYSYRYDVGWSVVQTPDSGYLISGYSRNYSILNAKDAYVVKIDKLGNVIWQTFLGGSKEDNIAYVDIAYDSNYLIAYSFAYKQETNGDPYQELCLVKLYPDKQLIWEKNYRIHHNSRVMTICKANNNDIIVSGNGYYYDQVNHNSGYRAYIMRLTEDGDSIWCRNYSHFPDTSGEFYSYIYDIKPSLEGGILACGDYGHYDLNINKSAWILKTDSTGSYTIGIKENQINPKNNPIFDVYPNPAHDYINININYAPYEPLIIDFFDSNGRLVKKSTITSRSQKISLSNLSEGLYYYIIRNRNNYKAINKILLVR